MKILHTTGLVFAAIVLLLALAPGYRPISEPTAAELGKKLFSDPILSSNRTQSCASCHRPEFAFSDTSSVSFGAEGQLGSRNTPGITNMSFRSHFFWDGRAGTLQQQVLMPIANPVEMNLSVADAVRRLRADESYVVLFRKVYNAAPDSVNLAAALTAFIETLETGNTAFDRWAEGDTTAMSASALRGRDLFLVKAKCFDCHFGPDFTGDEFRNIGLYDGQRLTDTGRFAISQDSLDLGRFKVPGLRNVALTAPYMHDGSFKTLRQVIDYYDNPNHFEPNAVNRDTLLAQPLGLSEQEKLDLEAFMLALTDKIFE
ncbi:MAG: c-type cytochrome [Lewinellaceae bacterium]|nr:c-type cytochrome [Lewinellaceae bacterium]